MNRLLSILLAALLLLPGYARAAEERPDYTSMSRMTMDYFSTVSTLQLFDDFDDPERVAACEQTWLEVKALLEHIDAVMSISHSQSDVSRYNALETGQSAEADEDTIAVLDLCRQVYEMTGGLYDPTVATLVDLFGFTPRFSERDYKPVKGYDRQKINGALPLPEAHSVEALRTLTDLSGIVLDGKMVKKTTPAAELDGVSYWQTLDLGGIAKGYAVDRVMELLRQKGYRYGYFSCGNSSIGILSRAVASKGAPEPAQWGVGVQYPRFGSQQEVLLRLFTQNRTLSTSGDYEHAFVLDGVRYTHLIDPRTGWPVNMPQEGTQSGICTATVLGDDAALCDALSTALCIMGPQSAVEFMNDPTMTGYDYVLILYDDRADYCEIVTSLPDRNYDILDTGHFHLASRVNGNHEVAYTGNLLLRD